MAKLRILIVDDNRDAADSCEVLLQSYGFEVRKAYRASVALGIVETFTPNLALLDIGMPEMSGRELAHELRQRFPDIRLIAITGWGTKEDIALNLKAGFDVHLTKPASLEDILSAVLRADLAFQAAL